MRAALGNVWRMPLDFLHALFFLTSSAALEACTRGMSGAKKRSERLTKPERGSDVAMISTQAVAHPALENAV
jgi:hypothetical protein